MLEPLYEVLSHLDGEENKLKTATVATPQIISDSIKLIFGEKIHFLDPLDFLENSYDKEKCRYIHKIRKLIRKAGRELKIPILAIWSTCLDLTSTDTIHWQTLVILPKHYRLLTGRYLNNPSEIVFFKDSQISATLPLIFKKWLNDVSSHSLQHKITQSPNSQAKYLFTDLEIHDEDLSNIQQQLSENDCGWWALYNACMFLMEGSVLFLQRFIEDPTLMKAANKLRDIFSLCTYKEKNTEIIRKIEVLSSRNFEDDISENMSIGTGVISFEKLVLMNDVYVDKTLHIKNIIDYAQTRINITRPRKWGKSINMDMLQLFFAPDVDIEGNFSFKSPNKYFNLFAGGEYTISQGNTCVMKKLKISEVSKGAYLKMEGQYPVIYITFKEACKEEVLSKECSGIRAAISTAYMKHEYLRVSLEKKRDESLNSGIRSSIQLKIDIFMGYQKRDNNFDLHKPIRFLTELMYEHFNRKIIVIIDEYDSLINSLDSSNKKYFDNHVYAIRSMFISAFKIKSEAKFKKVILIGILPLARGNISLVPDNFAFYGVDEKRYAKDFGFTDEEVNSLIAKRIGSSGATLIYQQARAKEWYNGYLIGESIIYNPWSIMSFISNAQEDFEYSLQPYWIETANRNIIEDIVTDSRIEEQLKVLIVNGFINYCVPRVLDFGNIDINEISFLFHTGYLTKSPTDICRIPNLEVREHFCRTILSNLIRKKNLKEFNISTIVSNILHNLENLNLYIRTIEQYVLDPLAEEQMTEKDFQIMLGGVTMLDAKDSEAKHIPHAELPNRFQKRVDAIFYPLENRSKTVIIHEYKKANSFADIDRVLENGVWQIYADKYLSEPLDYIKNHRITHWEEIITRVIVFFRNTTARKWIMRVKQFKHSISQAETINCLFSANGVLLGNHRDLFAGETQERMIRARTVFLEECGARSLYLLLGEEQEILPRKIYTQDEGGPEKKVKFTDELEEKAEREEPKVSYDIYNVTEWY